MKLQHDTHYITKSLDVRYITTDNKYQTTYFGQNTVYIIQII